MSTNHPLERAIKRIGLGKLAKHLGVTHQALRKWQRAGRMPRTEWTGESEYARRIEEVSGGAVKREELLDKWPKWPEGGNAAQAPPIG
jgi:DNA-binding transcriptional regulator YdaS (Cro superfamily)